MSGAKTEEPTTTRVRKAREEGDTGASTFASQAAALVVAVAILPATVAAAAARVEERLRDAIHQASAAAPAVAPGLEAAREARDVVLLSLPVLVGIAITATASSLVQTGGFVGVRRLVPRVDRLRPFRGLAALVSRERFLAVARAVAGGGFVAWVLLRQLRLHAPDIVRTSGRLAFAGPTAARMAATVAWEVALGGLVLAAVDVVVTRSLWWQRLRMSRDEVRRERKESEGNADVKGERARAHQELSARGASADAARATIVVADGTRVACALRYEPLRDGQGDRAPIVIATGEGEAARRIVRAALESGVSVREDAIVARALADVSAGEAIPERLYDAVAELLRDLPG